MRRIARPVSVRSDQLDAHELVGFRPGLRAHEVVDLTRRRARATKLDRDVVGRAVAGRQSSIAASSRDCNLSPGRSHHDNGRAARRVGEIGDTIEHRHAAIEVEPLAVDGNVDVDRRQRQDTPFVVAEVDRALYSRYQRKHHEPRIAPPGLGRGQRNREIAVAQRARRVME
jgi:hypothetical protein